MSDSETLIDRLSIEASPLITPALTCTIDHELQAVCVDSEIVLKLKQQISTLEESLRLRSLWVSLFILMNLPQVSLTRQEEMGKIAVFEANVKADKCLAKVVSIYR